MGGLTSRHDHGDGDAAGSQFSPQETLQGDGLRAVGGWRDPNHQADAGTLTAEAGLVPVDLRDDGRKTLAQQGFIEVAPGEEIAREIEMFFLVVHQAAGRETHLSIQAPSAWQGPLGPHPMAAVAQGSIRAHLRGQAITTVETELTRSVLGWKAAGAGVAALRMATHRGADLEAVAKKATHHGWIANGGERKTGFKPQLSWER